uniref:hypothetical protein n=1 Tax=Prevotella sp. TaxID=59823 RepID=UPI0040256A96
TCHSRRRYGEFALRFRENRGAVTVYRRGDFTETATLFGKKPTNGIFKGRKATLFPLYLTLPPSVKFRQ